MDRSSSRRPAEPISASRSKYVSPTRRGDERREGFALGRSGVTRVSNKLAVGIVEPPPSMQVVPCEACCERRFQSRLAPRLSGVSPRPDRCLGRPASRRRARHSGPSAHRSREGTHRRRPPPLSPRPPAIRLDPGCLGVVPLAGQRRRKRKSSFRYVNPSRRQPSTRSPDHSSTAGCVVSSPYSSDPARKPPSTGVPGPSVSASVGSVMNHSGWSAYRSAPAST